MTTQHRHRHRHTCPTCGQPLDNSRASDEEIESKRKYAVFKDYDYDALTLDSLKTQLDVMSDGDRTYLTDVMLRIITTPEQRSMILRDELPKVTVLYNKYMHNY